MIIDLFIKSSKPHLILLKINFFFSKKRFRPEIHLPQKKYMDLYLVIILFFSHDNERLHELQVHVLIKKNRKNHKSIVYFLRENKKIFFFFLITMNFPLREKKKIFFLFTMRFPLTREIILIFFFV